MAGVLVHIEAEGDRPSDHALAVLGEARRIGSSLGAAVHAMVVTTGDATATDALVAALEQGGADRVVVAIASRDRPALWGTIGPALLRACERVSPRLVLLSASATGRDLAPRLAAGLGGVFVAEPAIETGPRGEIALSRPVYGGASWRRIHLDDLAPVAVATLDHRRARARGRDRAARVDFTSGEAERDAGLELLTTVDDGNAELDTARVVVTVGGGVSADAMTWVERLAQALGAALGGTRAACARGIVAASREVGVGRRRIAPDLYIACGASGSMAHLGGVSPDADIVAIDVDPNAPIWRAARWGLLGRVEDRVPALVAALEAT